MTWRVGYTISTLVVLHVLRAVASLATAEPPIPFDADGHVLFRKGAPCGFKVEIYLDLACTDCEAAWPTIVQAADEFGRGAEFIFRLFPLPYHKNAFTAAQAALVVKDHFEEDDEVVESFVGRVFEGQSQILNSATAEMTQGEIQDIFAGWAADVTGISTKEFAMGMADGRLDQKTRYQFKYGCLHAVYGTALVFVGGILSESLSNGASSISSWRDVLGPLVPDALVNRRKFYRSDGAVVTTPWRGTEMAPCRQNQREHELL